MCLKMQKWIMSQVAAICLQQCFHSDRVRKPPSPTSPWIFNCLISLNDRVKWSAAAPLQLSIHKFMVPINIFFPGNVTHAAASPHASSVILLILPDKHLGTCKIHHLQLTSPPGMWTLGQFFCCLFICLFMFGRVVTCLPFSAILRVQGLHSLF